MTIVRDYFVAVKLLSHIWLFATCEQQHYRLPCPSPSPRVCSDSCPFSQWRSLTISSFAALFSFCLQSFQTSGSPVSQFFTSGGQSIRASATTSVLPMSIQGWFPLGLTGFISLQSRGPSRVKRLSSTTIWNHQFFGAQSSLWSEAYIHTCLLDKS